MKLRPLRLRGSSTDGSVWTMVVVVQHFQRIALASRLSSFKDGIFREARRARRQSAKRAASRAPKQGLSQGKEERRKGLNCAAQQLPRDHRSARAGNDNIGLHSTHSVHPAQTSCCQLKFSQEVS
jgi:hypothetical protein